MFGEFKSAFHALRKQPGFSLLAVGTLALGIGSAAAVFSLIEGVLLTPPPYRDPERLVLISPERSSPLAKSAPDGFAPLQWMAWQRESRSFDSIAGYFWTFGFLIQDDGSQSVQGMNVTRTYFKTMGVEPILGRVFSEADDAPNAAPVVILGYDLWQRRFGGDPNILGKLVRFTRRSLTVVGVLPRGVRFLPAPSASQEPNYDVNNQVQFLQPAAPREDGFKNLSWNVIGRLTAGTSVVAAETELKGIASRMADAEPAFAGFEPRLQPLVSFMNADGKRILLPLLGAAGLVLLISCGNAAALLLVRGLGRHHEYAIRSAMGARRSSLFILVLRESVLLASLGAVLGVALSFGIVTVFKRIGGHAIPRLDAVSVGWPALLFGAATGVASAALAGLLPAFRASGLDPVDALKSAGPRSGGSRLDRSRLRAVTIAQAALTLTLLVGALLLVRTMNRLMSVETGYSVDHILTMSVTFVEGKWREFHPRALEEVRKLPGVQHVAFAWGVPLTGNSWPGRVTIEGHASGSEASARLAIPSRSVTPDYFELIGLKMKEGRTFADADDQEAPRVVIVNQALVDAYFPGQSAIGRKIWMSPGDPKQPPNEIVGVVGNGRTDDLSRKAAPEIYVSMWQKPPFSKHLLIRFAGDPRPLTASIERTLRSVAPTVAVEQIKTFEEVREDSQATRVFAMRLLVGFAAVAGLLTLVGIYGVITLSVTSRTREIAIRSAIGAQGSDVLRLILQEGVQVVGTGVVLGLVASIALSQALTSFLYEVSPVDPPTLVAAALAFGVVALFACWIPARRALNIAPTDALRTEGI